MSEEEYYSEEEVDYEPDYAHQTSILLDFIKNSKNGTISSSHTIEELDSAYNDFEGFEDGFKDFHEEYYQFIKNEYPKAEILKDILDYIKNPKSFNLNQTNNLYDEYIDKLKKDIDSKKIKIKDSIIPEYLKTFDEKVSEIITNYRTPSKIRSFDLKIDPPILLQLYNKLKRKRSVEKSTKSEQETKRRKLIDKILDEELINGPLNIPIQEKDGSKSRKKSRKKSRRKSRKKSRMKSRRKSRRKY